MDLFGLKKRRKEKNFNQELNLAINQELSFFGDAVLEHLKSYQELADISKSKINPEFEKTNYQQQSGFSAEVKHVARTNAENIMDGNDIRIARTDNIGEVNHPQYDYVLVDKNNNPLRDANGNLLGGTQQKNFSRIENYDKLLGREYEHYKDARIAVPPDQYQEIVQRWNDKLSSYKQQLKHLQMKGDTEKIADIETKIRQIEDVKSRTIQTKVSTADAMEARKSPLFSTFKDIRKVSHRAGMTAMKYGAPMGGAISAIQNFYAFSRGEKELKEAATAIVFDTGKAAAVSYVTGAASAAVSGALKTTGNQICQTLSKGNMPAAILNIGTLLARNVFSLIQGQITPDQFVKNIGQEGATLAASLTGANLGAVVGSCIFPGLGSIIGGIVGGISATLISGAMHAELLKTLEKTRICYEQRKHITACCKKLKEQEIAYREMICCCIDRFLDRKESDIKNSFEEISSAIVNGKSIHQGLHQLSQALNQKLTFTNLDDFKDHLSNGKTLHL